jgi:multidrug efflux pump subunit AcrA (membrane-fusion protein)
MAKSFVFGACLVLAALATGADPSARAADPVVSGCLVKLEGDVKLGAREPGVLVELKVKEGSMVTKGEVIGQIDDSEAQIKKAAAEWALAAAIKQAKNDVQARYAKVSAEVNEKAYEMFTGANKAMAKSVSQVEVDKAYLEWQASVLSAEKAAFDQEMAKYDAQVKQAELNAAKLGLDRRVIRAEFDGQVVKLFRRQGEWVGPGDPILRLVRLDTMLVEGPVELSAYDSHELQNCEVTVEAEFAHGRKERFNGRITFVSPLVRLDGKYIVRAEVNNREQNGQWLLRDGMTANMMIHLSTGGATPLNVSRRP